MGLIGFSAVPAIATGHEMHMHTKEDCKYGGWETHEHHEFKNQGECVSHVVIHGNHHH